MRKFLLVVTVVALALSACTAEDSTAPNPEAARDAATPGDSTGLTPEIGEDATQLKGCDSFETDLSKEPNLKVDYIHRWTTEKGCGVRLDILMTRQGENACGGARVADILMGTPLGRPNDSSPARIYVKDPANVFQDDRTSEGFDPDADLPADARDSRYRQEGVELWTVPEEPQYIYLVSDDHAERWPQDETPPGCG